MKNLKWLLVFIGVSLVSCASTNSRMEMKGNKKAIQSKFLGYIIILTYIFLVSCDNGNTSLPITEDITIINQANNRKMSILSAPDTVVGTYYISNNGSDANDGKSPTSAWATLDKVNNAQLTSSDIVVFERSGLWRGQIIAQEGVTYSAYGTGEKPKIYASPENGTGKDKWIQISDNIWKFYKDLQECGGIVFNEGERWAYKTFDTSQLQKDFDFYSEDKTNWAVELEGLSWGTVPKEAGALYLRSDKGNPGEIFTSIEFLSWGNLVIPADHTKYDNLCLKYCGSHAIFNCWGSNIIVQNCEFGWGLVEVSIVMTMGIMCDLEMG
jgi:hypothetical protein